MIMTLNISEMADNFIWTSEIWKKKHHDLKEMGQLNLHHHSHEHSSQILLDFCGPKGQDGDNGDSLQCTYWI